MIDLNHGSGAVYGGAANASATERINALIDAALVRRNCAQTPRTYLGGSRIGEPCARKLVYEYTHTPLDAGKDFDGRTLRIFDAGHQFEALSIRWLRAAGFDLRTHRSDGEQFGFVTANGRIRGHIDGVIVGGPDIGVAWPVLFEHKALNAKSWSDTVKAAACSGRSRSTSPSYKSTWPTWSLETALFTALNKDTQALHHEIVAFDARAAQALSDKAVDVIRAAEAGELPPRIAASPDFYLCRWCAYAQRCWEGAV